MLIPHVFYQPFSTVHDPWRDSQESHRGFSHARRAVLAGFRVIEIHAAHGYLLQSFLSPLSNPRAHPYGGNLENRMRFLLQVAAALRQTIHDDMPLFTRISATDWVEGGWDIDQSVELARALKSVGVDLIDASSGGIVPRAVIPAAPGYQVPFAAAIREQADVPTGAVGLITDPAQADAIITSRQADLVFLAREMLREPYWALKAGRALGQEQKWPVQYERAKP
jgi:2,4-dienoyl-CoA reductase-like NADH-dependent reductase (Old Yellow Enzyme family)